ncbi:hypothetical protein B0H12DRAFT_684762 [Mycena haematopus]|nr:hypothetical protein B0H12DRAFT_684762 [Mycena haematopus]
MLRVHRRHRLLPLRDVLLNDHSLIGQDLINALLYVQIGRPVLDRKMILHHIYYTASNLRHLSPWSEQRSIFIFQPVGVGGGLLLRAFLLTYA